MWATIMPRPLESIKGQAVRSRMFLTGGISPSAGSSSRIFFSVMVGKLLYASRVVNGPWKLRMTVPGLLPGLRSMLNGPLFQVCHDNVPMPSSLPSAPCTLHHSPYIRPATRSPQGLAQLADGMHAETCPLSIG